MRLISSSVVAAALLLAGGPVLAEQPQAVAAATAEAGGATSAAPAETTAGGGGSSGSTVPAPVQQSTAAAADAKDDPAKPSAEPAKPAPPPTTLKVAIDLSKQRMTVSEHGKVKYAWPISSGRAGYRTPTGTYRPQWAARMWYSKKYDDAPMPHSVFFHDGFAIHATAATGRLGSPASHGCVRLAPGAAATFYKLVHKHGFAQTRISIKGVARDAAPAFAASKSTKQYAQGGNYAAPSQPYWGYGGGSVKKSPKTPSYGSGDPRISYSAKPYRGGGGFPSFFD